MQENSDKEIEGEKASWMHRLVERFGIKRLIIAAACILAGLWVLNVVVDWFAGPVELHQPVAVRQVSPVAHPDAEITVKELRPKSPPDGHRVTAQSPKDNYNPKDVSAGPLPAPTGSASGQGTAPPNPYPAAHQSGSQTAAGAPTVSVNGVAFVDAVIGPLDYELNGRFYGWRPNDIFDFTDNINNFQLGVLEVTRRTAVVLAERISRTGSTASFDRDLESAMNWLMIRPTQYWFPSPESVYGDSLNAMKKYRDRIIHGGAPFHVRSDNLIPLLIAYEDLLGSSDENLVKHYEANGDPVSFFKTDDYFFYAKGVASAMHPILTAVALDFQQTLEARRGMEVIHHAIESLEYAIEIAPIVITDSDLSGILANHRANMAAPISHARFFLGVLIKTLST